MENLITSTVRSSSMLITNGGYCVKLERFNNEPICFFVNKAFQHVLWKLTIKKGIILDKREFWRMRKDWKLEEISLSDEQFNEALVLGEKILKDPYHGLSNYDRKRLNIPDHFTIVNQQKRLAQPEKRFIPDPKGRTVTLGECFKQAEVKKVVANKKPIPVVKITETSSEEKLKYGRCMIDKFYMRYPKPKQQAG